MRAAGAAGVAPPAGATAVAPSPYGGGPPPPAPGAGGVGIKRQAGRASGSADPMVMEESSYYGGPPPPPPGAGAIAAQLLTSILQQTARDQEAARYAVNEAHLAKALHAHSAEAQRMVIPEAIRPVHNNTIKTILKKDHVRQPITPAAPTAAEQIANVDLSNAEGAAIAHARGGGNASTLMEKLIDTAARPLEPARSAVPKVLNNLHQKGVHGDGRRSSDSPQGLNQEGCGERRSGASSRTCESRPCPTRAHTSASLLSTTAASTAASDKATSKRQGRP